LFILQEKGEKLFQNQKTIFSFSDPKGVPAIHGPQFNSVTYLPRKRTPQRVGKFVNSMSSERTLCSHTGYVVSMAGWLWTARQESASRSKDMQLFLLRQVTLVPGHSASYSWVTGIISTGIQHPGREAHRSLPSFATITNVWMHTFTLPYVLTLISTETSRPCIDNSTIHRVPGGGGRLSPAGAQLYKYTNIRYRL